MVHVNTTRSIDRASTILGARCEETKKGMSELAKRLYGSAKPEMEKVALPILPGVKDDVIFCAVNGVKFYFLRGDTVEMPKAVFEVLRNTGTI